MGQGIQERTKSICGRRSLKNLKSISGPLLNTLTHIILTFVQLSLVKMIKYYF